MNAPTTVPVITVVGVGALGSHVVLLLRNVHGVLHVIDADRVEKKNLAAQFHGRPGLGKFKVQALAQTMQFLYDVKLATWTRWLNSENVHELLGGSDLVIDCLDNGESRRIVQMYVRERHIPCLHGALAPGGAFGRVVWDEAFVIDDEASQGAATCEDGAFLPFIVVVAALLAEAVGEFNRSGKKRGFSVSPAGVISL